MHAHGRGLWKLVDIAGFQWHELSLKNYDGWFCDRGFCICLIVGLITGSRVVLEFALGFLPGGLYGASGKRCRFWVLWLPVVVVVFLLLLRRLNNLSLGDDIAQNLGEKPERPGRTRLFFADLSPE
ncbi:MAG: hypothetical protein CM1200mP39_23860 [Dehalococcoidia bacterium]|nr:MAG: hypothetical protein CM1200mP39_23860 [Dehalococcoidia bacterium]